jgi:hypothetical protein
MATTNDRTEKLNSLLRGELSAVETYRQAIDKVHIGREQLRRIQDEHIDAVNVLRQHITDRGGTPATGSGPWGVWANLVQKAANVVGPETALKSLKEGERHGIDEYEEAIQDESVEAECKSLISTTLLPRQREHLQMLDNLLKGQQG